MIFGKVSQTGMWNLMNYTINPATNDVILRTPEASQAATCIAGNVLPAPRRRLATNAPGGGEDDIIRRRVNTVFKYSWNFTRILWSHILSLWFEGGHSVRNIDLGGAIVCSGGVAGASLASGRKLAPGLAGELL
ncbi:hypothetical protein [Thiolapillus sp.]